MYSECTVYGIQYAANRQNFLNDSGSTFGVKYFTRIENTENFLLGTMCILERSFRRLESLKHNDRDIYKTFNLLSETRTFLEMNELNWFHNPVNPLSVQCLRHWKAYQYSQIHRAQKLHEYILNGLSSQLNDRMKSLPVNFRLYRMLKILFSKMFIAPKDSP